MITTLLDTARAARAELIDAAHTSAFRLFNGFLEGCPALSVDIFARTAVMHDYLAATGDSQAEAALHWLLETLPWVGCVVLKQRNAKTDVGKRGLLVHGTSPDHKICEHGTWYAINLVMNQDTSFYLDTRNLRAWAAANLVGKTVLNTFAYTGSLGVAALAGRAARVIQLDRNKTFLQLARQSCALNGLNAAAQDFLAQDFFPAVAQFKRNGMKFDCVFLDPPFFAATAGGRVDLEAGSSRLINKVRPLINDGGWLVAINNALYLSGKEYLASLEALCADGYLAIEQLIPVPPDFSGYPETIRTAAPADPAPFNHSTKIAILRVRRKAGPATN